MLEEKVFLKNSECVRPSAREGGEGVGEEIETQQATCTEVDSIAHAVDPRHISTEPAVFSARAANRVSHAP